MSQVFPQKESQNNILLGEFTWYDVRRLAVTEECSAVLGLGTCSPLLTSARGSAGRR